MENKDKKIIELLNKAKQEIVPKTVWLNQILDLNFEKKQGRIFININYIIGQLRNISKLKLKVILPIGLSLVALILILFNIQTTNVVIKYVDTMTTGLIQTTILEEDYLKQIGEEDILVVLDNKDLDFFDQSYNKNEI